MQQNLLTTLRAGMQYGKAWPLVSELNSVFPENQIIRLTRFGQQVLPALSVLSLFVQLNFFGQAYLAPALASALFLLLLPFQGWYWLGRRSMSELPPAMLSWYLEIADKLRSHGMTVLNPQAKPCYADLARVLQQAVSQLDKAFIRHYL
jgi:uncharacterized membrane protein YfbV (UPF0208 family)